MKTHITPIETLMQQLQSTAKPLVHTSASHEAVEFSFKIVFDAGSATLAQVETVDNRGRAVVVDPHRTPGPEDLLLRTLEDIDRQRRQNVWGNDSTAIYLCDHPVVLSRLLDCHNLVGEDMRPLAVKDYGRDLLLTLKEVNGDCYQAAFAVMDADKGLIGDVRLLSEQYALAGQGIYPIKSVGERFQTIAQFAITFAKTQLDVYLSALFSYLSNITLYNFPYKIRHIDIPSATMPTLVFESVDSDMTLNMRLTSQAQSGNDQFDQSALTMQVNVDHEGRQVVIRHVEHIDLYAEAVFLKKVFNECTPSKKELKNLYVEKVSDAGWGKSAEQYYFYSVPPALASAFLTNGLPSILGRYNLVGSDKLLDFKVRPVKPRLNVSIGSGIDFLEGTANVDINGHTISVHDLIAQYEKNHYITLTDGNRALIDEKFMQRLIRIFSKAVKKDGKLKISFFDLPEVEDLLGEQLKGAAMERSHKVYAGFNLLADQHMTFKQVNATLRNYQKEGVKWINYLYENNLGGCLADDMGLGKTLQTIAMLARIYPKVKQPSLIVMPRSLLFNWENELKRFAPQLSFSIYYGQQRDLDEALKSQLVLTTYALVRNDAEQLIKQQFHYVILDESQNIKNVTAQATKAVTLLKAKHRLALSGTPIENNLTELYSLFRFLNPAMFGSVQEFNANYTIPIQRDADSEAAATLRRKVFPFILRRLKADVLTELPARIDQTITVEMDAKHQAFYEQRRSFYEEMINNTMKEKGVAGAQFLMFQALSELRQAASIPELLTDGKVAGAKVGPLIDSLNEAVDNGHKAVVFFNFIYGIEMVEEQLDKLGIQCAVMTGSTTNRRAVIERFQNDPQCMVMLMTVKTGGVGLNLTAADTVYIFEPWWNKAAEEQAINRLHRIGQKAKVLSYSIIVHNTIEEKIRLLQQRKVELTDAVISSDSDMNKQLSEEDIQFILS